MRVAVMVGANRSDDDAKRTLLGRDRRALPARGAELSVTRPVLVRHHVVVDEDDLALYRAVGRSAKRIDAVEISDFTGHALRHRRSAVAERGDHQLLGKWGDNLRTLRTASPDRHRERLDMHIGESHRSE